MGEERHAGAHFPLCGFTKNASSRSNEAREGRASRPGWKGKEVAAVAEHSKGKGKRGAAVAEDCKGKGQWDAAVAACPAYPDSGTRRRWGHFDSTWSWK